MAVSERIRKVKPPIYRGMPYVTIALFLIGLVVYRNWRTHGLAQEQLFNLWLLYAFVVLGFYFVFGIAGQFAFSQAAVFGLGGYVSAWATFNHSHPVFVGMIAAAVVVLVVSFLFALLMQKTEHFYFAVGTLGLQTIIVLIITQWSHFTHAGGGEVSGIRPWSMFGHQ